MRSFQMSNTPFRLIDVKLPSAISCIYKTKNEGTDGAATGELNKGRCVNALGERVWKEVKEKSKGIFERRLGA